MRGEAQIVSKSGKVKYLVGVAEVKQYCTDLKELPDISTTEIMIYLLHASGLKRFSGRQKVMPKSRAEIQKEYRERKKREGGSQYLKKETERVKKYYVPTAELSEKKLGKRRRKIRHAMRKTREKKKRILNMIEQSHTDDNHNIIQNRNEAVLNTEQNRIDQEDTGPCDSTTDSGILTQQLHVKMNFRTPGKKKNTALTRANTTIQDLRSRIESLQRSNERMRKKIYRQNKSDADNLPSTSGLQDISKLTPRKRVKADLQSVGISPSRPNARLLRKKLEFQYAILDQVKQNFQHLQSLRNSKPRSQLRVFCGNLIRKYRLETRLASNLGIPRKHVLKTLKNNEHTRRRLPARRLNIVNRVQTFLNRDDNSTCLPGKADAVKVSGTKQQRRVLNDYLYNLHIKFLSENKDLNISLSVFNRIRPKNFQLVKFSSRKTCLCQKHQNMALKVKTLKLHGATTTNSPDTLVKLNTDDEILSTIDNINENKIKFSEWKRVDVEHKGRTLKRMQIVTSEEQKKEFQNRMKKELAEFRQHISRVKCQYEQVRKLKESLPTNHAICQMDFAENYSCGHAEEVQSAYFDKATVTLHPVVIYTNTGSENTLTHKSCVIVSNESTHNATTVYAFMKKVVAEVTNINKEIKVIHYVTDSPTSQYRNKYIFGVIARHDMLFNGIKCSWQYFEAGHGKGPCDGVGGTAKRCADSAVKRHTHVIQTAEDFYNWGSSLEVKSQIKYLFVPKSQCQEAQQEIETFNVIPVKGTLNIHSVVPLGHGSIAVRNTSCFCDSCFSDGTFHPSCDGWTRIQLVEITTGQSEKEDDESIEQCNLSKIPDETQDQDHSNLQAETQYDVDSYVTAVYDGKWYLGKICEYDPEDLEYNITFMEEGKNKKFYSFKWPEVADNIWIPESSIICQVREPIASGTGTRKVYRLDSKEIDKILSLFQNGW